MPDDISPIAAARLESALTAEDAARIMGMSLGAYLRIEEHPLEMTIGELRALYSELNEDGMKVLARWSLGILEANQVLNG